MSALLSVSEARKRLSGKWPGLTADTIRRALKDCRLTGTRLGRYWYIEESSLADFSMRGAWANYRRKRVKK